MDTHTHTHTHTHAHTHTRTCTHTHARTYAHIYTHTHAYTHTHTHAHTHTHTRAHTHTQATQLGTKQIDEDGLLDLVRTRPARKNQVTAPKRLIKKSPPTPQGCRVRSPSVTTPTTSHMTPVATPTRSHMTTAATPTGSHMTTPSPVMSSSSPSVATPNIEGLTLSCLSFDFTIILCITSLAYLSPCVSLSLSLRFRNHP